MDGGIGLLAERLRREFIELLEKDAEFRYTVAGYLGLSEILKRLDSIEENIRKLWEGQNKLWEEVRALREGQNKIWEEVKSLREGQNRLWEEVKLLRRDQERMRSHIISGFSELRSALGVTYEMHAAAYIELLLEEMGYPGARVEKKYLVHDGEVLEINIFSEKPIVVGEVTTSIRDTESALREVEKLLVRVKVVEQKYGRKPDLIILSVGTAPKDVADNLREKSEKHGFRLILGREIEEALKI